MNKYAYARPYIIPNKGYTDERYKIGIQQEDIFLSLMLINNVILNTMSETDIYSSVDFHLPNTDVYIELKYRRINKNTYSHLLFDSDKLKRWNNDLPNSIIYIAFSFQDGDNCFIKYDKKYSIRLINLT
jgi:hypothetical protein